MKAVCTTFGACVEPAVAALVVVLMPMPTTPLLSPLPVVFIPTPCSVSGLLAGGGCIVADVGEVNSIGSPCGDSEDVSGDGKWLLRDFGLLPPKGLRGTDSKIVAMALKDVQAILKDSMYKMQRA
jgi:hypothetical protein